MDKNTSAARAETLRALHHGQDVLLLPNAWDVLTARVFEQQGFPAVATTSGGIAWALGYGDGEQTPLAEVLAAVGRITRVVKVPVTVDFEGGYGASAQAVGESVRAIIQAGAAGINLEDSLPGHGPLRPVDEAAARIRAARQAADQAGVPIVINARVDAWMHAKDNPQAPLEDAIARGRAYLAAGADCLYPIGLLDVPVISAFTTALNAPVNIMAVAATPPLAELKAAGVKRLSTATALTALALGSVRNAVRTIRDTGTFGALRSDFNYTDAQSLFTTTAG
ncbi:isocitrate lyase/phosphoenolpyruvate mutase family protein [Castellaniella caeni]